MKVFVELNNFAGTASREALKRKVRELEDIGATGVSLWDHMFISQDGPRSSASVRPCDPLTTLAAIAGLSDSLELQTVVANASWAHPAILLRQFAQLALLVGGERITAGLGAGWNAEEFDALGMKMLPLAERLIRLEETFQIARQLYDTGTANLEGQYITACDLPLNPVPNTPPSLLIGGGSQRIMEIAGRYADVLDLVGGILNRNTSASPGTIWEQHVAAGSLQALTKTSDLAERMALVRVVLRRAGRSEQAVRASVQVFYVAFGSTTEIRSVEEELCKVWGDIPPQSLAQNPYVLLGDAAHIAETLRDREEIFGLSQIMLTERNNIAGAPPNAVRFCKEVLPRL